MVDAQPVDPALADLAEDGLVRAVEDVRLLDPQAGERVHVEEAAIVDVARRHPPMGEAVGLGFEQPVQGAEAVRPALEAVEERQRPLRRLLDGGRHGVDGREPPLQVLGLLREAPAAGLVGVERHRPQALGDGEQLRRRVVVHGADGGQNPAEDRRVAEGPDRELVLVVPDAEGALLGVELQFEMAVLQRLAVALAEERDHEVAARAEALPIDVEGVGEGRERPPFQHREPPRVVGAADAHVVGHDVEEELQPVCVQRVGEADEVALAAEFRVDPAMVHDVVAVGRAGPRLLERRGVDVADPERGEIRDDPFRVGEGEVLVELQAVGRPRRGIRQPRGAARAAILRREGGGELGERPARRGDLGEVAVELAPPVGVALRRARHVGLGEFGDHVLVLHGRQHRGGAGEVAGGALERRGLRRLGFGQQLLPGQGLREAAALHHALAALGLGPFLVVEAQRLAGVGVDPAPPADEGRQVVGGDGGERVARVGARRLEPAVALALEGEDAVAQHAGLHQRVGEALRRRAEILGDDEALVAVALQPQHREHRLEGHGDVGAGMRPLPQGDQEQPGELEGVVDADRAGMAHVRLNERAEGPEPVPLHLQRVEGGQAPVLALGRQQVRRGADRHPVGEALGMGPDLRSAPVGADREVAVEAEPHPRVLGRLRGSGELRVGEILDPREVAHLLGMVGGEGAHRFRAGAAEFLRPIAEPLGAASLEVGGQGLEQRVRGEVLAALPAEAVERLVGAGPGRGLGPERAQHRIEHGGDPGMVDEGGLAQGRDGGRRLGEQPFRPRALEPGQVARRDEQGLEEQPRGRRIGRDLRPVRAEQGVDGAEPQEGRAAQGRLAGGLARVGIGADADVAGGAQAVELRRQAPVGRALLRIGAGAPAALRRGDDEGFRAGVAHRHRQPVVAGG